MVQQFNNSDIVVEIAKELVKDETVARYVDMSQSTRPEDEKLWNFNTLVKSLTRLVGNSDTLETEAQIFDAEIKAKTFISTVISLLPENAHDENQYMWRNSATLQGIAEYAKNLLKRSESIDLENILKDALSKVEMTWRNEQFGQLGGAPYDENDEVIFTGSGQALSIIRDTLLHTGRPLDADGKVIREAYGK